MPRIPTARLVAPLCVLALASTACGAPESSDLSVADVEELAEVAEVFTEPVDQEPIPTPRRPELLGLDSRPTGEPRSSDGDAGEVPPSILAFEEAEDAPAASPQSTLSPAPAVGSDDVADESEATAAAQPDIEDTAEGSSLGSADDDVAEEVETEEALPPPAPAAAPVSPGYEDPSSTLFAASGRAIELLSAEDGGLTTRGVTADTVTVGGLASLTLAGAEFRADTCVGARARFEQANHHGELTRTILFEDCYDDAGQADLAGGLARTLVRDEVFAVAPVASPAFGAESVFGEATMPYVGFDALPAFCGRTNSVGFGAHGAQRCPVLEARGFVTLSLPVLTAYEASHPGDPFPSIAYGVEAGPHGEAVSAARTFEAELLGVPLPVFAPVLPASADGPRADWSDVVRDLRSLGTDAIFIEGGATEGLPAALRADGFEGDIVYVGLVDPLVMADADERAALAALTVIAPGLDLASRDTAGWNAMESAATAVGYAPVDVGIGFIEGYVAADFLVRALAATPEPLSAEEFVNTINAGWWYPGVDGLACGSWWPASHLVSVPCVSIARVDPFSDQLVSVLGLVETEPQVRFELGR